MSNSNSKDLDVRHHPLRELVRQGDISVNHGPSEYQDVDILTEVSAFDLFSIRRRFSTNLRDQKSCDLADRQVDVCLCLYVFSSVDTAGGLYQFQ